MERFIQETQYANGHMMAGGQGGDGIALVGYSALSAWPFVMQPTHDPLVRAVVQDMMMSQSSSQSSSSPSSLNIAKPSWRHSPDVSRDDVNVVDNVHHMDESAASSAVLLKWAWSRGVIGIPRSSQASHNQINTDAVSRRRVIPSSSSSSSSSLVEYEDAVTLSDEALALLFAPSLLISSPILGMLPGEREVVHALKQKLDLITL